MGKNKFGKFFEFKAKLGMKAREFKKFIRGIPMRLYLIRLKLEKQLKKAKKKHEVKMKRNKKRLNEPAEVNYFFQKGYRDYAKTIKGVFGGCRDLIVDCWDKVRENFVDLVDIFLDSFQGEDSLISKAFAVLLGMVTEGGIKNAFYVGLYLGKLIMTAILTGGLSVVLAAVQGLVLVVVMGVVYLGFTVVAFADKVYRLFRRISQKCPNCQEKFDLPYYVCECGEVHKRLIPSKYGILKRKCVCGRELKTTFFNGRHKLPGTWICPKCKYELGGSTLATNISIPIVGGPHAGKTNYLTMAIHELDSYSKNLNLDFQYIRNKNADDFQRNLNNILKGQYIIKTTDSKLRYYQFYLTPKGESVKNIISLCDISGEAFEEENKGMQVGFGNADGYMLLIDPLSIPEYLKEIAKKADIGKYGGSAKPMDEVLTAFMHILENMRNYNSGSRIGANLAVVFTKCDLPLLEDKIGKSAVNEYRKTHPSASIFSATNFVCAKFLREYGEANFFNALIHKFQNVQFFTCSAWGNRSAGGAPKPQGVAEPILWLVDKVKSINASSLWS